MDSMDPRQDWLEDDTLSEDELREHFAADGWERVEVVVSRAELDDDGVEVNVRETSVTRRGVPNVYF